MKKASDEQTSFLLTDKDSFVFDNKFCSDNKKKLLKAYLQTVLMAELSRRSAMSALDMIDFFEKKFNVRISPGTIYPILYKLERSKHIRRLPKGIKKFYELTDFGRKSLENLRHKIDEDHKFIANLLEVIMLTSK